MDWFMRKMSWQTIVLLNGLHVPFIQCGDPNQTGKSDEKRHPKCSTLLAYLPTFTPKMHELCT
jgi:hypothetical protein